MKSILKNIKTMKTRIFWITKYLAIMPKPNADEHLEEDIIHFKNQNVTTLVSLLTQNETFELELEKEKELCEKHSIHFISFPLKDRSVPSETQTSKLKELARELAQKISQNQKVIVHCRGGIGRAGMICAAILIEQGVRKDKVIEKISTARGVSIPDTEEQKKWIMGY